MWYPIKGYPKNEATREGVVRSKRWERKNIKFSPTTNKQHQTFIPAKVIKYDSAGKLTLKNGYFSKRLSREDILALIVLDDVEDGE